MSLRGDWSDATARPVVRRAALMAVVVGHVIGAINHGVAILAGTMTATAWVKVAITFAVPYCVSTLSSVLAIRERRAAPAARNRTGTRPCPMGTAESASGAARR